MSKSISPAPPATTMRDFLAVTKALADENRVRMLLAVGRQELCLCQIVELAELAPSTVSKHMSILWHAGLVEGRKSGRWMYYRLAGPNASPAVQQAIQWVKACLRQDPRAARDAQRLEAILKLDPRQLCESQCPPKTRCGKPRARTANGR